MCKSTPQGCISCPWTNDKITKCSMKRLSLWSPCQTRTYLGPAEIVEPDSGHTCRIKSHWVKRDYRAKGWPQIEPWFSGKVLISTDREMHSIGVGRTNHAYWE
ncbi:hypothetical protein DL98DRAFT_522960 [Cadophora sp. DSE1049]|nr:hypothetical protein DL98DRAFT_522960 [Cadophora sp. DSE1049]